MNLRILTASTILLLAAPALGDTSMRILVNGQTLSKIEMNQVLDVEVVQDVSSPDRCKLNFVLTPSGPLNSVFEIGSDLEILIGKADAESIFQGEVMGIEPNYKSGGESMIVVLGYDKSYRLEWGRRTRTWKNVSDFELVTMIAAEYGLVAEGEDTGLRHEFVYQRNQTDLEFLRQRAARIGYLLEAEGELLRFRSTVLSPQSPVEIERFQPDKLSDRDVPGPLRIVVRAWDPVQKEEIVGEAKTDTHQAGPGVTYVIDSGDKLAEEPGVNSQFLVFSRQELELITQAQLRQKLRQSRSVHGQAAGDPKIRAGQTIELSGLGKPFNGMYFIENVTHELPNMGGYKIKLSFRRDAERGT